MRKMQAQVNVHRNYCTMLRLQTTALSALLFSAIWCQPEAHEFHYTDTIDSGELSKFPAQLWLRKAIRCCSQARLRKREALPRQTDSARSGLLVCFRSAQWLLGWQKFNVGRMSAMVRLAWRLPARKIQRRHGMASPDCPSYQRRGRPGRDRPGA
jgi:hypothetical protein